MFITQHVFIFCVFFAILQRSVFISAEDVLAKFSAEDSKKCLSFDQKVNPLGVLPVYGWDNIRNMECGMVINTKYTDCKLSEDGDYLVPDNVNLIPIKTSKVDTFSDIITTLNQYSSLTAKTINAEAGFNYKGLGISGTFSESYERAKSMQIGSEMYVARSELRFTKYKVKLQPNVPLHPSFQTALDEIAKSIEVNHTDNARYLSELLVRDYGTHFLTSIDAGAALIREDTITKKYVDSSKTNKAEISSSLSANFFGVLNLGVSFSSRRESQKSSAFSQHVQRSSIMTYGGSVFSITNDSISDWTKSLDRNLVALDRSGEPIFNLVNSYNLPRLSTSVVQKVADQIEGAVKRYYEYNTHPGCMDAVSPNYAISANVDDDTCQSPLTNLTFAGVFQTCQQINQDVHDFCSENSQPNPKTGDYSCPVNYKPVLLHTEILPRSHSIRSCYKCGFLWLGRCCKTTIYYYHTVLSSYWCSADGQVAEQSGFLFGGFFTSSDKKSCPSSYFPRKFLNGLSICLSENYYLGTKASIPFGGFFSCNKGNPQAKEGIGESKLTGQGEDSWPKACPKGFSAHLLKIEQDCGVYACLVSQDMPPSVPIQSLPISPKPHWEIPEKMEVGNWTAHSESMALIDGEVEMVESPGNHGVTAALSIIVTLVFVGVVFGLVMYLRSKTGKRHIRQVKSSV